ncbi:type IV secretory system conjugative DNA transfer family protein [Nonomuraea fuscirosea]|uniref:type IV secretory system conjugative DNA transfer family protein n=1 Tax=Nonomuraea fuscirosea TaxID=1291556 RepID=UPI00371FCCAC
MTLLDHLFHDPDVLLAFVLKWLHRDGWKVAVAVPPGVLAVSLSRFLLTRLRHKATAKGARCLEILAPPVADLHGAEALWGNLLGLLRPAWKRVLFGQPHLTFEYHFGAGGVRILMWVPGTVPQHLVDHAVEAAWPSARTTVVEAAPPVPLSGRATGGQFVIAREERLPIRSNHDQDPLRALLGAGVGMPAWQHAAVQILARPATGRRLSRPAVPVAVLRAILDLTVPGPSRQHPEPDHALRLERYAEARAVRDKALQPRFEVAIRYAVQGDDGGVAKLRRRAIRGRAHSVAAAFALYSGHNRLKRRRLLRPARVLASRHLGRGFLLSVPELAALAHLPTDPAVPGVRRAGANAVAPTPQVAQHGKVLGTADAGHQRPVALRVPDSCHHVHILGPNGTGKSTLLAQMIRSDIEDGRGVAVIDAKGDLVADLLGLIPEAAGERIALIDPDDPHSRPALNVLSGPNQDTLVDNLVGIFHKIYSDSWGPRSDDILRGCALTLSRRGGTLADIPALLTDPAYRHQLTGHLDDPFLAGFWTWYERLSEQAQSHVTAPIMNKLRAFLLRPFVRDILGSAQSTFHVGDVLDGKILLARLPKGVLGDDTVRLLGSLLLAQVWQAASHRARLGRSRAPSALYVDETQNFLNLPRALSDMLAEARAYGVSIVLAHQHLAQLPRDLTQAISSDARNKIYFTLSPEDARDTEHHFSPYLTRHDLANLGAYQAAARLIVRAGETPPFTLRTHPLPDPDPDLAQRIRSAAARAHGRAPARPEVLPRDDPRQQPDTDGEPHT